MKIFYYVVHPQLEEVGDFKETNGWKEISVYHIVENQLELIVNFETALSNDSQKDILEFIHNDIDADEIIKLVEL